MRRGGRRWIKKGTERRRMMKMGWEENNEEGGVGVGKEWRRLCGGWGVGGSFPVNFLTITPFLYLMRSRRKINLWYSAYTHLYIYIYTLYILTYICTYIIEIHLWNLATCIFFFDLSIYITVNRTAVGDGKICETLLFRHWDLMLL